MKSIKGKRVCPRVGPAAIGIIGLSLAWPLAAEAAFEPVTFTASSGQRSASAMFEVVGPNLVVTLANTSQYDVLAPSDVLSAVFFDIDPALAMSQSLRRISATLAPGSALYFGSTQVTVPSTAIGGEWGYKGGLQNAPGNAVLGISSSGFGLFSPKDRFSSVSITPPDSLNGIDYGLTSAGDNLLTGNGGLEQMVKNSVVFTLGLPAGYQLSGIDKVSFQYGTSLTEPRLVGIPAVPEPTTFLAGGLLMLPLIFRLRPAWRCLHPSRS